MQLYILWHEWNSSWNGNISSEGKCCQAQPQFSLLSSLTKSSQEITLKMSLSFLNTSLIENCIELDIIYFFLFSLVLMFCRYEDMEVFDSVRSSRSHNVCLSAHFVKSNLAQISAVSQFSLCGLSAFSQLYISSQEHRADKQTVTKILHLVYTKKSLIVKLKWILLARSLYLQSTWYF